MALLRSFPPVARPDALVLILGSMPGERSLQQQQYYAYPHNAFWPLMARLLGFPENLPYPERLEMLKCNRVALWDVLAACRRQGSLDSAIDANSIQPNDFSTFLAAHRQLRAIFFNGAPAEQLFRRHILRQLGPLSPGLMLQRLPSTSPANARLNLEQKLEQWQRVRHALCVN